MELDEYPEDLPMPDDSAVQAELLRLKQLYESGFTGQLALAQPVPSYIEQEEQSEWFQDIVRQAGCACTTEVKKNGK